MRVLLDVAAGRRADASLEQRARGLAHPDRALCQEIAFGALRWKLLLDQRLDGLLRRGLDSIPLTVRAILEVAAYQLIFLDRVPAHAAVHDAVEHVRALLPPAQARGLAGVVNATLRSLAAATGDAVAAQQAPAASGSGELRHERSEVAQAPGPTGAARGFSAAASSGRESSIGELASVHSHPEWLVARWVARFGPARARAILEANNRRPGVHLRPHAGRTTASALLEQLLDEGADVSVHPLSSECLVLRRKDPTTLTAFREGLVAVQDVSAQIISRIVPDVPQGLVVDVCAAPGGKAGALAERAGGATFIAADVSPRRLLRLRETALRQSLPLRAVVADARTLPLRRPATLVLADVPCLGTGTLRRRVDARWLRTPEQLARLVELEREIAESAARLLAPGGRLLYSTCSLEAEENEEVVHRLLESTPDLGLLDLSSRVPPEFRLPIGAGGEAALFITPEAGDCDGAFAALLEKAA